MSGHSRAARLTTWFYQFTTAAVYCISCTQGFETANVRCVPVAGTGTGTGTQDLSMYNAKPSMLSLACRATRCALLCESVHDVT